MRVVIININSDAAMLDGCNTIAATLRDIDPTVKTTIIHWEHVHAGAVAKIRPSAVVVGPNETPFPAYPPAFDTFLGWLRRRRSATLGICGGHQALALAHGAPVGPVHDVAAATVSYEGMPKVRGDVWVRLIGDHDPLTGGLPDEIAVHASHVDEVKEVPTGFRLLAIGDPCNIQAFRSDRWPIWGVQFHPEKPVESDAAWWGRSLLENFLAAASGVR